MRVTVYARHLTASQRSVPSSDGSLTVDSYEMQGGGAALVDLTRSIPVNMKLELTYVASARRGQERMVARRDGMVLLSQIH